MDLLRTDIEIAQSVEMEPITKVAERTGIDEDYLEQKAQAALNAPKKENVKSQGGSDYRAQKERQSAINRAAGELKRAEEKIARLEDEIAAMEEKLATPEYSTDYVKAAEMSGKIDAKRSELDSCYEAWEKAQENYDSLTEG